MGRIKTVLVKRITKELMEKHGDKLSNNFEENKEIVGKLSNVASSKMRNIIAGYATRLVKQMSSDKTQRKRSIKNEDLSKFYT